MSDNILASIPVSKDKINANGSDAWAVTVFRVDEEHIRIAIFDNDSYRLPHTCGFCSNTFSNDNVDVQEFGNSRDDEFNRYFNEDGGFFLIPKPYASEMPHLCNESCDSVLKVDDQFVRLMRERKREPFDRLCTILAKDISQGFEKSRLFGSAVVLNLKTEIGEWVTNFVPVSIHPSSST